MQNNTTLSHIALETGKHPRHSIIWLHGLGADGQDFAPIAEQLALPAAVRHIFPDAPLRSVTINGGYVMRAWYDISTPDIGARQDAAGIRASQAAIEALIAREIERDVAPGNIFLAGFSQGGAIALHTALRQGVPLGGVLALSSYLPLAEAVSAETSTAALRTPIFMAHGRSDTIVPCALGNASRKALGELGCEVEWHEYAMPHSICPEELLDIQRWLTERINAG